MTTLFFFIGLVFLIAGAEALVRGASRLAAALGLSPLVIGLTVVAYGTSAPELSVSVQSALSGQVDIALGNVVGSNIFNVLFILGVSALIAPLLVAQQLVHLDVPLMIGVSVLLLVLALDGVVGRVDGALLCVGMVVYTIFAIRLSWSEGATIQEEYTREFGNQAAKTTTSLLVQIGYIVIGLALLVFGSRWLVSGAVTFAQWLGVSELVIGLTIIAAGTSLPEVATSIIASIRGERDIAVGNVVGSNIFNILAVLGLSSIVAAEGIPVSSAVLRFDLPVMIAVAVACLPIFVSGHLIARWEGALFFAYYIAYTLYLILDAAGHDALPAFSGLMLSAVLPLTVITLTVITVRTLHTQRD
jgi:cation:H+ antiporter